MSDSATITTTGRRKTAVARVSLTPGTGKIIINKRDFEEYFPTVAMQNELLEPFQVAESVNKWDMVVNTSGGGKNGQVDAIRLGIARGLLQNDSELRDALRGANLLTRDSRKRERKKPGQPGARKRFQFSKR